MKVRRVMKPEKCRPIWLIEWLFQPGNCRSAHARSKDGNGSPAAGRDRLNSAKTFRSEEFTDGGASHSSNQNEI